jgi:hypothetical protein
MSLALLSLACGAEMEKNHGHSPISPRGPLPGDPTFVRDPALNVALESAAGGTRSHHAGESCMACHQEHGPGRGRFTVAGTISDASGRAVSAGSVSLTVPGSSAPAKLVPVDSLGNFYTTEDVGLDARELTVTVEGANGAGRTTMPFPTLSGACNHCHTGTSGVRLAP